MTSCVLSVLLQIGACSPADLTAPGNGDDVTATSAVVAGTVIDLSVASATDSSITVRWTGVDDGRGGEASYRLKYSVPPIDWSEAEIGCDRTIDGIEVGELASCTVEGLAPNTEYDLQLMSFRLLNGRWHGAVYSNIATGRTSSGVGEVTDLRVTGATASTLTLEWTQVGDGVGEPAWYRVKYQQPPFAWSSAEIGCDATMRGTEVGAPYSCIITGLASNTDYDVQLRSFRSVDGVWVESRLSNLVQGRTRNGPQEAHGIWIDRGTLMQRPASGAEWEELLDDAQRDPGVADISDQDSNHDVFTLAAALVCVRTGEYCAKARQGVLDAIGTEDGARWLAVGRNLGAYVIAADLLGLRADGVAGSEGTRVQEWMEAWMTKPLMNNNPPYDLRGIVPFGSGANASAQEGFVYLALAAYLGDAAALERGWEAFRTFACDPGASDPVNLSQNLSRLVQDGWTHDDVNPCAVNPAGTSKAVPAGLPGAGSVRRIDGSIGGDMRRGGLYQWLPGYTAYPWVGLQGFVPAAVILQRAGYPALEVADRAVYRTLEYLWYLRNNTGDVQWFDGIRASEIVSLVNVAYGASFPINEVVNGGRTVGYTSWTHASRSAFVPPAP